MADGALFRGVRRRQCLPSRCAHRDCAVAPRPHWFGLPADCGHRARDSGTLPDGSGFGTTWAEIILRKDAWRVVLDGRPLSTPRGAARIASVRQPHYLWVSAAARADRDRLAQPRRHDRDHVEGRSWPRTEPERTKNVRLVQPVVYGGLWRVADGSRMANRSVKEERSQHAVKGIDTIGPPYYTVADGDGQTTTAWEAGVDVGGHSRSPAWRRASVLHATESNPRSAGFRQIRREPLQ